MNSATNRAENTLGRPPKPDHLKRTERVVVTMTPTEHAQFLSFVEQSDSEGINDFARQAIFDKMRGAKQKEDQ